MSRSETLRRIQDGGLVPILRTPSPDDALALAELLAETGVPCLEVPLTVPGALDVIHELAASIGGRCAVGAGTVLSVADADACLAAGATFIVTPTLDVEVVAHCKARDVAVFPGALTPTEILAAWRAGASAIKVFPASAVGGPAYLRAIKGPLPEIPLVPTGGVTLENAAAFIQAGAVALGVGSDFVDLDALHGGDHGRIADRARRYLAAVANARA